MNKSNFIHLRLHTEFSIVDSTIKISDIMARAADDGQGAMGLTDFGNTFAYLKFYKSARSHGLKPILGVDIGVQNLTKQSAPCRLLLFCMNNSGYRRLCRLISMAWLSNSSRQGYMDFEWLKEKDQILGGKMSDDLICLIGGLSGEISEKGVNASASVVKNEVVGKIKTFLPVFEDRLYLEIQKAGFMGEDQYNELLISTAAKFATPVVATHPVQFLDKQDFISHQARVCIAEGETLSGAVRGKIFTEDQYFCKLEEMFKKFSDFPEALENSYEIGKRCNLEFELNKVKLPEFKADSEISLDSYLMQKAKEGYARKIEKFYDLGKSDSKQQKLYLDRLSSECEVITTMGFSSYFLIVADFVNWAKANNVPVGPGRGSGAGSLVAYCLGITDINPIPFSLLFERFLNPERISMPDFDIDFCQDKRHLVIEYVRDKYGSQSVSQIVTFGTMASRAVIRDAGRVLEMPYSFCDQLSKLIPVVQNKPLSLKEARKKEPLIVRRERDEEEVSTVLELAKPLEDLVRNVGMHAGGVLIAPGALNDFCALYKAPGTDGKEGVISMFDKDDVEKLGLVKFDFLGLRNLTSLALTVNQVNRLHPELDLKLESLNSFDDVETYDLLKQANTIAVFQLESDGMRRYLSKLQPDNFEDIIAMLALYRPGPLNSGMVDDFIKRKQGLQKIDYFHPDLKDCLSATYGVIVYQEQVMQIAQIIAGYSLGSADILRRAMGKKKLDEMAQQREVFLNGAKANGYTESLGNRLFDLMEKFAEYGFNKSHTAAYAVITYQTAWLKVHHTAAFFAATLTSEINDTDRICLLVKDAESNGISLLTPDVNESAYNFEAIISDDKFENSNSNIKCIRYGLGAIKGVGEAAISHLIEIRKNKKFEDFFDFCCRVDHKLINKKAFESLVASGAADSLIKNDKLNRKEVLEGLDQFLMLANQILAEKNQSSLFSDELSRESVKVGFVKKNYFPEREKLLLEKAALGFCFSKHLFSLIAEEAKRYMKNSLRNLRPSDEPYWVHGIVMSVRKQMSRKGPIHIMRIEDNVASVDITVFNDLQEKFKSEIHEDHYLATLIKAEFDEYSGGTRLVAQDFLSLSGVRMKYLKELELEICDDMIEAENVKNTIQKLRRLLSSKNQNSKYLIPVCFKLNLGSLTCRAKLSKSWRIEATDCLIDDIRSFLGENSVKFFYRD